jgi:Acetyl xylan esterase (AXE1)
MKAALRILFQRNVNIGMFMNILLLMNIGVFAMGDRVDSFARSNKLMDSLPDVLGKDHADLIDARLRQEALMKYEEHQLPQNSEEWHSFRAQLKAQIMQKTGAISDHQLPLNMQETGSIKMKGYTIKNIFFQTSPGIYATANLYIPDGRGPFPAVIHMHGHWTDAKADETCVQQVGHTLALNGYVCLTIDAFGAGERSTIHGRPEYHGSNLGASLMNIGASLMGLQISDNMRAVDLLCSLPFVDASRIGATGASGGGNQTMWLTAMDERIKAAVPVVSVGTFESYVMHSNCICELLIDGLTFTEEAGVLALVAPRAMKICTHLKDDNPTFQPVEMLKSYRRAKCVYAMLGVSNNMSYQLSDTTHGYWAVDREAMLGWFDLHLKGTGSGTPKKEIPFETLPAERLMVFAPGKRDPRVVTIEAYCKQKGNEWRSAFLHTSSFDVQLKRKELKEILRCNEPSAIEKIYTYSKNKGWDRCTIETTDGKLLPLLYLAPRRTGRDYVIICHAKGKTGIPHDIVKRYEDRGMGIVVVDLYGTGEASSPNADTLLDDRMPFHTLARAELWLGKTVLGEWVKELNIMTDLLKSHYHARKIEIDGTREAGLAGLFLAGCKGKVNALVLRDAPVSYLFDRRDSVDFFTMGIHLPGFLNWGDVSLAAALSGVDVSFIHPRTMSGRIMQKEELEKYQQEFEQVRRNSKQPGTTYFQ